MFENAVGSTIWMIFLRAVGTLLGSTLGYAAYQSGNGNQISMGAVIVILLIPAYYVQLGTRYQKAAMIFSVTMCVVSLSTHLHTVPGTSLENFSKRAVASLISQFLSFVYYLQWGFQTANLGNPTGFFRWWNRIPHTHHCIPRQSPNKAQRIPRFRNLPNQYNGNLCCSWCGRKANPYAEAPPVPEAFRTCSQEG